MVISYYNGEAVGLQRKKATFSNHGLLHNVFVATHKHQARRGNIMKEQRFSLYSTCFELLQWCICDDLYDWLVDDRVMTLLSTVECNRNMRHLST